MTRFLKQKQRFVKWTKKPNEKYSKVTKRLKMRNIDVVNASKLKGSRTNPILCGTFEFLKKVVECKLAKILA